PEITSLDVKGDKALLSFAHVYGGLMKKGRELTHFTIAGEDRMFYPAKAKIKGTTVEVRAKEVKMPKAVRFAFSDVAEPNLYNSEGLPASAFRTDSWE
ncbi:MAG: sialate O-acetylesterase, partial [Bacteroidota bacterium]